MIDQEAIVVETAPEVIVEVKPQSSCGACQSGGGCGAGVLGGLFKSKGMRTRVQTDLNLEIGDTVNISLHEKVLLQAAIMLYLTPVMMMIIFPLVGQQVVANTFNLSPDMAAIFLGVTGFVGGLLLSRGLASNADVAGRIPVVTKRIENRTITVSVCPK